MTGVNLLGILIIYGALFVFGVFSLVAFVVFVLRKFRAAMFVLASGILCTALIIVAGTLTFLHREYSHDEEPLIVMVALIFFFAGIGPFVAAFRGMRTFAAAIGCVVGSILFLSGPAFDGADFVGIHIGLDAIMIPLVAAGLLMTIVGLVIAVFFPLDRRAKSLQA